MIKQLRVGEIFYINGEEYIINLREHNNGRDTWRQPNLIKLKEAIKRTSRKRTFKYSDEIPFKKMIKSFKSCKGVLKNE